MLAFSQIMLFLRRLVNLLGESPEMMDPWPCVTSSHGSGRFFALEVKLFFCAQYIGAIIF